MSRDLKTAPCMAAIMVAAMFGTMPAKAGEVIWWTPNWGQARAEELARKFEAANPDTKIRLEITVSDGLPTKILTSLQSGSAPDLIEAQHGWVAPYAQNNLIVPLDDAITDRADYIPTALEYVTWDSRLWGIPYRLDAAAVIYNKGMFAAAGLNPEKPPQTWEELIDAAKKLTGKNSAGRDQYGFAITGGGEFGNTVFRSLPFIWMNGGSIISDDMKRVTVSEKPAVDAVAFYTDFLTKHKVSPPSTLQNDGTANRRLFIAETVAIYQSGQFDIPAIRKENPKIDIGVMMIPHPPGKETAVILGGWSFIIPKGAKNPEEAKKFVRFMAEAQNMGFFTDTLPARKSAMDMERFKDPILTEFKNMLPYGRTLPQHKNWIQITQRYFEGVQRVLTGETTPQKAMDEAAAEITDLLE